MRPSLLLLVLACASAAVQALADAIPEPQIISRGDNLYSYYSIPVAGGGQNYSAAHNLCASQGAHLLTLDDLSEYTDLFVGEDSLFPPDSFLYKGSSSTWLGLINDTGSTVEGELSWDDGEPHMDFFNPGTAVYRWQQFNFTDYTCANGQSKKCCAALWFFGQFNTKPTVLYYECSLNVGINFNRLDQNMYWQVVCKAPKPGSPPPEPLPLPATPPAPEPCPSVPELKGPCGGEGFVHMACYYANKTVYAVNKSKSECMRTFERSSNGTGCEGEIFSWGHNTYGCATFLAYKFNEKSCLTAYLAYEEHCERIVKNQLNLPSVIAATEYKTLYRCIGRSDPPAPPCPQQAAAPPQYPSVPLPPPSYPPPPPSKA